MIPIRTENLSKTYKKGLKKKVESLKGLNLEVHRGEIFGFIGANGAGKSTTIKILMGLLRPTSGSAWLWDKPVSVPEARKGIGYLAEHPQFYGYLNPLELLTFIGKLNGQDDGDAKKKAKELLALVLLEEAAKRPIRTFSKGMVQRTGIATVLMNDPDLVILDEPMSGLDPLGRHLVSSIIRDLQKRGKTVFFSTHIIPDIETLCDKVGILVKGELKYVGSIQEALYPPGGSFEMTFRITDPVISSSEIEEKFEVIWQKEALFKIELEENDIPDVIGWLMKNKGTVVSLEPKKRSLEELFLDLMPSQNN